MQNKVRTLSRRFASATSKGKFVITPGVVAVLLAWAVLAFGGSATTPAGTLYVPSDFATIQEAVDAATAGDTIVVAPGAYAGAIVNKAVTIMGSTDPANPSVVNYGPVVRGTLRGGFILDSGSDGATISSFTIECSVVSRLVYGVYAGGSAYSWLSLTDLLITDALWGVQLYNVNNSLVANNSITLLSNPPIGIGVLLVDSSVNTLQGNTIRGASALLGIALISYSATSAFNKILANDLRELTASNQVALDVMTDNSGNSPWDHPYELPHHNTFMNNDYGPVSSSSATLPYYGGLWILGTDNAFINETFWGSDTYPYTGIYAIPSVPSVVLDQYVYNYWDTDGQEHIVTAQSARNRILALKMGLAPNGFDLCGQVWDATGLNAAFIEGYRRCRAPAR